MQRTLVTTLTTLTTLAGGTIALPAAADQPPAAPAVQTPSDGRTVRAAQHDHSWGRWRRR
ncbi:hypothetical protein ACFQQB_47865 [Nonomuraea rubra]